MATLTAFNPSELTETMAEQRTVDYQGSRQNNYN